MNWVKMVEKSITRIYIWVGTKFLDSNETNLLFVLISDKAGCISAFRPDSGTPQISEYRRVLVETMVFDYKKNRPWVENLTIIMQLGLTMVGCILFCFFIGFKLDGWMGTKGVFVAVFTILGVVGGAITAYRQIMEITLPDKEDKTRSNDCRG